ncbi:MAG: response regulator [Planctomycetota bacterium]|jgi:CheY-like chemotaxis protein|nr:response regulator [Planctomycetota bacterium]MDP6940802.1 response regulator [Planctomycetota bacterium]
MGYVCPSPTPGTENFRILLVEDNPADAETVRFQLQKSDWTDALLSSAEGSRSEIHVTHVRTLKSALGVLEGGGVDAVFLDLGLPDSMGIRTLDSVRGRYPKMPIVVLAGNHSYLDEEEIKSRGVCHIWKKEGR